MRLFLFSFIGVDPYVQDENLFRHFFDYYVENGIDEFKIILHSNEETSDYIDKYKKILRSEYNIIPVKEISNNPKPFLEIKGDIYKQVIDEESKKMEERDWFVYADSDEFIYTEGQDFKTFLNDKTQFNCIRGQLIDRVSKELDLPPVKSNIDLTEQFPLSLHRKSAKKLRFGSTKKVCFTKYPYYCPHQSHHWPTLDMNRKNDIPKPWFSEFLPVNHYRWTDIIFKKYEMRKINGGLMLGVIKSIHDTKKLPQEVQRLVVSDTSIMTPYKKELKQQILIDIQKFLCKSVRDRNHSEYIIKNDIYRVFSIDDEIDYVIDIGSCLGEISYTCSKLFPTAKVISVEPTTTSFGMIQENLKCCKNVSFVNNGIYKEDGIGLNVIIRKASNYGCNHTIISSSDDCECMSKTFKTILNEFDVDLNKNVFLKIDCEGCEQYIVEHIDIMRRIYQIGIEFHHTNNDEIVNKYDEFINNISKTHEVINGKYISGSQCEICFRKK